MAKKYFQIRRVVQGMVALGMLLSLFGAPGLSVQNAGAAFQVVQPGGDSDGTGICLLPGTVELPLKALGAIKSALLAARNEMDFGGAECFAPIDRRNEREWLIVTMIGLKNLQDSADWTVSDNGVWSDNVIVHFIPTPHAAIAGTALFSRELNQIPSTVISENSKKIIDPLSPKPKAAALGNLIIPFESGYQVYYGTKGGGIHPGEFIFTGGMPQGSLAVDLMSDGNTGAGHAPNRVYAAGGGTVVKKCSDAAKNSTYLIVDDGTQRFLYAHVKSSTAPALWSTVSQGSSLGEMVPGTFNDSVCGYASQAANFFHVHLEFPATTSLTLGDWTLNTSTEIWTRGSETWPAGQWRQINNGGTTCNPSADQIALYVDPNYGGACVVKGIGDYLNPASLGIANDSVSSIKVGGNVKLTLCRDDNYLNTCETFTGDDPNLSDNSIGDNQVSSAKVESRNPSCNPNADQVAFFIDADYAGVCVVKGIGEYLNPSAMGMSNDSLSSIKVGANVKLTLCRDDNYLGICETFTGDDSNLTDNSVGNDQASSVKVETRSAPVQETFLSAAAYDGFVLEKSESSGAGSLIRATGTLRLGDETSNRQYRSIFHFDTAGLPDNAVITKATLKIRKYNTVGANPFTALGSLLADIRTGPFGGNPALYAADFQATASKTNVGKLTLVSGTTDWYQLVMASLDLSFINKTGATQFRLRFKLDDNNDFANNYLNVYGGDAGAANRPQLIIEYYVP